MFDEIVTGFRFDIGGVQKMTRWFLIYQHLPKVFQMECLYQLYLEERNI